MLKESNCSLSWKQQNYSVGQANIQLSLSQDIEFNVQILARSGATCYNWFRGSLGWNGKYIKDGGPQYWVVQNF